jgi:drug/metabolite transporter (DMT)-like permease
MLYLLIASVIWAFSFGLIKHKLVGVGLDPNLVALVRLLLSLLIFVPLIRLKSVERRFAAKLVLIGALQFGLMYVAYTNSYLFLSAHQVAMFTIFTPLYVTLINDCREKRFNGMFLLSALLAVAGTGIIVYGSLDYRGILLGFLMVQVSNVCFALGQVWYRGLAGGQGAGGSGKGVKDRDVFAFLYLGGVLVALVPGLAMPEWGDVHISAGQVVTLLYLGILPSGVCFFLWNVGAKRVNAGTLAVFNNAKIPLAVLCSLVIFGEKTDLSRLVAGGFVIAVALVINERKSALLSRRATSPREPPK